VPRQHPGGDRAGDDPARDAEPGEAGERVPAGNDVLHEDDRDEPDAEDDTGDAGATVPAPQRNADGQHDQAADEEHGAQGRVRRGGSGRRPRDREDRGDEVVAVQGPLVDDVVQAAADERRDCDDDQGVPDDLGVLAAAPRLVDEDEVDGREANGVSLAAAIPLEGWFGGGGAGRSDCAR